MKAEILQVYTGTRSWRAWPGDYEQTQNTWVPGTEVPAKTILQLELGLCSLLPAPVVGGILSSSS